MEIEDKSRIKKIEFKYPEILSPDAEKLLKDKYYELQQLQQKLSDTRMLVVSLEESVAEKKKFFNDLSELVNIEFETVHKEHIFQKCNFGVINPTDASNKSYGK